MIMAANLALRCRRGFGFRWIAPPPKAYQHRLGSSHNNPCLVVVLSILCGSICQDSTEGLVSGGVPVLDRLGRVLESISTGSLDCAYRLGILWRGRSEPNRKQVPTFSVRIPASSVLAGVVSSSGPRSVPGGIGEIEEECRGPQLGQQ